MSKFSITTKRWIIIVLRELLSLAIVLGALYYFVWIKAEVSVEEALVPIGIALVFIIFIEYANLRLTKVAIEVDEETVTVHHLIGKATRIKVGEGLEIRNDKDGSRKMWVKTGTEETPFGKGKVFVELDSFDSYEDKESLVAELKTLAKAKILYYDKETKGYVEQHEAS